MLRIKNELDLKFKENVKWVTINLRLIIDTRNSRDYKTKRPVLQCAFHRRPRLSVCVFFYRNDCYLSIMCKFSLTKKSLSNFIIFQRRLFADRLPFLKINYVMIDDRVL